MPSQPFTEDESGLPNWLAALSKLTSQSKPGSIYPAPVPEPSAPVPAPESANFATGPVASGNDPQSVPEGSPLPAPPRRAMRFPAVDSGVPGTGSFMAPPPPPGPGLFMGHRPDQDALEASPDKFTYKYYEGEPPVATPASVRVPVQRVGPPPAISTNIQVDPQPPNVPNPDRQPTPDKQGSIGPTGPSLATLAQAAHPAEGFEQTYAKVLRDNLPYEKAMEARQKDLDRYHNAEAQLMLNAGLAGTGHNHAAQAAAVGQLGALQTKPIHTDTLSEASKAGQEHAKLIQDSWKLDPESPISREAQMAYVASSEFEAAANGIAKQTGQDPLAVKKYLYQRARGLNSVGIAAFTSVMKSSGDYSKQRADEAYSYALNEQSQAVTRQLGVETQSREFVIKNLQNPSSLISQSLRKTIAAINPAAADVPNFDKMSGADLYNAFPGLMPASAEIMKYRQEYMMRFQAESEVDNDWRVTSTTPTGMAGGLAGLPVANQEGIQRKAQFRQEVQSGKIAVDTYDNVMRRVQNLNANGAVSVSLKTNTGRELLQDMINLTEALSMTSPYAKQLNEELRGLSQGTAFTPGDFLFGTASGKQRNIHSALMMMNSNLGNNSKPFVNKTLERGEIPPTPPVWIPFKTDKSTQVVPPGGGAPVQGYEFQIGNKKVLYFRDGTGNWINRVVG